MPTAKPKSDPQESREFWTPIKRSSEWWTEHIQNRTRDFVCNLSNHPHEAEAAFKRALSDFGATAHEDLVAGTLLAYSVLMRMTGRDSEARDLTACAMFNPVCVPIWCIQGEARKTEEFRTASHMIGVGPVVFIGNRAQAFNRKPANRAHIFQRRGSHHLSEHQTPRDGGPLADASTEDILHALKLRFNTCADQLAEEIATWYIGERQREGEFSKRGLDAIQNLVDASPHKSEGGAA